MDSGVKGMENKSYRRWHRLMMLGAGTGCHQKPERSLYIHGWQLPVCARCTGVIFGYLIALPAFLLTGLHLILSLVGCLIMFVDWFLQQKGFKESHNDRRVVTGVLGGFGIMSLQLYIITRILSVLKR